MPIFPTYPAYIKRIVGLPGDRIRVEKGIGVFLNDKLLSEPLVAEPANYSLSTLADISGRNSPGELLHPYGDSAKPIVVPNGMLFLLGDNRNNSLESHIFGFVPEDRTAGRAWTIWQPVWQYMHTPYCKRSGN